MPLANSCAEVVITKAMEKFFPGFQAVFNRDDQATHGMQIILDSAFPYFCGENVTCLTIHKTPEDREAFKYTIQNLNKQTIYTLRSGRVGGAGHFNALYYIEGQGWILDSGKKGNERVLVDSDNNLTDVFDYSIGVSPETTCGEKDGNYKVTISEITRERAIAGMNFIADFRLAPIPHNFAPSYGEDEILWGEALESQKVEFLGKDILETMERDLKSEDTSFFRPSENAIQYWSGSNFSSINAYYSDPKHIQESKIKEYLFLFVEKNEVIFLDKLIELGYDVNARDAEGNTLLHLAVIKNNANALKKLISEGADLSIRNKEGLSAMNLSHRKIEQYSGDRNKDFNDTRDRLQKQRTENTLRKRYKSRLDDEMSSFPIDEIYINNLLKQYTVDIVYRVEITTLALSHALTIYNETGGFNGFKEPLDRLIKDRLSETAAVENQSLVETCFAVVPSSQLRTETVNKLSSYLKDEYPNTLGPLVDVILDAPLERLRAYQRASDSFIASVIKPENHQEYYYSALDVLMLNLEKINSKTAQELDPNGDAQVEKNRQDISNCLNALLANPDLSEAVKADIRVKLVRGKYPPVEVINPDNIDNRDSTFSVLSELGDRGASYSASHSHHNSNVAQGPGVSPASDSAGSKPNLSWLQYIANFFIYIANFLTGGRYNWGYYSGDLPNNQANPVERGQSSIGVSVYTRLPIISAGTTGALNGDEQKSHKVNEVTRRNSNPR